MVIIETSIFTRQVLSLMTDDEYRALQHALVTRPTAGNLIRGSGGLRKLRWSMSAQGKCGGVRVIYYWAAHQEQLLLLFMYPKNVQDDLTPAQLERLRSIVEEEFP
jgi:hypothetical protein